MGWAVVNWIILEGRALSDGLLRDGSTLLNFSPTHFLSYCEFILRETEEGDAHLNDLYDVALIRVDRRAEIAAAMAAFGG